MSKSKIQEYSLLEKQLADMMEKMEHLHNDPVLKDELSFKTDLEKLMKKHNQTADDVVGILKPENLEDGGAKKTTPARKKRKLKVYQHPETEEVIETRGGNHKQLREWRDEYGADMVESWLLRTED